MTSHPRLGQHKHFFATALVLAWTLLQPCFAQSNRYSVAVLPFVVTDPTGKTPEALGETLPNYFEAPVFNSQKFILIDRSITDKIMEEIMLSDQGFTGEKIKEFGDLYGIDIFINGSITVEQQSEQPYVINARFTDASTGEVKSVSLVRAASTSEFQAAAQQIIDQAITRFPLRGFVYAIEGSVIYIDVGSIHGLSQQDRTGLIYREIPIKEKTLREQIGTFTIDTVYEDSSKITAQMNTGYQVQEGDIVTVEPIATSVTATAPTPEAVKGSLSVETNVPAQVFLNGGAFGQTPLNTEVTAGEHKLELRADGYQTIEKSITVSASQILSLTETLETELGNVTLTGLPNNTTVRIGDKRTELVSGSKMIELEPGWYTLYFSAEGYVDQNIPLYLGPGESKMQRVVLVPESPSNRPLSVNAGPDQTITLPASATLRGSVSDDGLPSDNLTITWSKSSGPGAVTFDDTSLLVTRASFSQAGTYVLHLTASDGALKRIDSVIITVKSRALATLTVSGLPANAKVRINDERTILIPVGRKELELEPGLYILVFDAPGYASQDIAVNLEEGTTTSQEVILTPGFSDNFDDGNASGWELESGWRVERDGGNYVLSGEGHRWASLQLGQDWTDYSFECRLKILEGGIHFNYRHSGDRYYIAIHEYGTYLLTDAPGRLHQLLEENTNVLHGLGVWHDVKIVGEGSHLKVYVDGTLEIDYIDPKPLTRGTIAFETLDDSHVLIDDVKVTGP